MKWRSSVEFPDPRETLAEGIIAVGGKLDTGTLYTDYSQGIFPWPQEGLPLLWFSPERRGILDFSKFRVPQSLRKFRRQNPHYEITFNQDFDQVIEECARQKRPGQNGTWILSGLKKAYKDFHRQGYAHSVEVRENNILMGGVYGVLVRGVFAGESMFHKRPNISKLALWALVEHLKAKGHGWMDIQMVTPVAELFGGEYIDREEFLERLMLRHTQVQNLPPEFHF